ncbi:type II toxin-antitoxin system Phd/YefM family antitoxin [Gluconobacter sp. OJB]|uniref:type II toxin-antitoxin system Phd/YefM family antitoxin n=1 Tax=Gluconobacter sp. OJB TaxID=3145196 RepID=UPI0031F9CC34
MQTMSAKDTKNGSKLPLEWAKVKSVQVEKHGSSVAVSVEEFQRLSLTSGAILEKTEE